MDGEPLRTGQRNTSIGKNRDSEPMPHWMATRFEEWWETVRGGDFSECLHDDFHRLKNQRPHLETFDSPENAESPNPLCLEEAWTVYDRFLESFCEVKNHQLPYDSRHLFFRSQENKTEPGIEWSPAWKEPEINVQGLNEPEQGSAYL